MAKKTVCNLDLCFFSKLVHFSSNAIELSNKKASFVSKLE